MAITDPDGNNDMLCTYNDEHYLACPMCVCRPIIIVDCGVIVIRVNSSSKSDVWWQTEIGSPVLSLNRGDKSGLLNR